MLETEVLPFAQDDTHADYLVLAQVSFYIEVVAVRSLPQTGSQPLHAFIPEGQNMTQPARSTAIKTGVRLDNRYCRFADFPVGHSAQ